MSDSNSYEDEQDETEQRDPVRTQLKNVTARLKESDAENVSGREAKRELAFLKVGIDTDSPVGKLFFRTYDGDLSMDAIRVAATELNLVTPKEDPLAEDKAAMGRMSEAAKAGVTGVVQADFTTRIANAKNRAEYDAIVAQAQAEYNI